MKKRGETKFDRGWTRFNCLNKGYVIPDWAREPDESKWKKEWFDKHNAEVRENERRTNKKTGI